MKIKLLKLCLRASSITGLFLLFFVLFYGQAKAVGPTVFDLPITGGAITVMTATNPMVLFCSIVDTNISATVNYNGYNLATLYVDEITTGYYSKVFYLNNPTSGTHNISFSGGYSPVCSLASNVNTDNLILASSTVAVADNTNATSTATIISTGSNSLILDFESGYNGGGPDSINSTRVNWSNASLGGYKNVYLFFNKATSTNGIITTHSELNWFNRKHHLFALNTQLGPITCTSFTYSDWGACGSNPNYPSYQFRDITSKSPTDCTIDVINNPYADLSRICSSAPKIQLPYIWKGLLTPDSYQRFQYLYTATEITNANDYIKMYRCTGDNGECTQLTPITFYNGSILNTPTTTLSVKEPFGLKTYTEGVSMFIIQPPTDLTITQDVKYRFYLYQGGVQTQTEVRSIKWYTETDYYPTIEEEIPDMECSAPSYDITTICSDIADTGSLLGATQCGFKYAFVTSAQFLFYPTCSSLNYISNNYVSFKHSFPFNSYFDLTSSVNKAIDTSLATTTSNNFSIPFIKKTATSSEYYMLPVLSSTTISNTIGTNNYNTLKLTFGFIWWILSAVIVFFIVTKL